MASLDSGIWHCDTSKVFGSLWLPGCLPKPFSKPVVGAKLPFASEWRQNSHAPWAETGLTVPPTMRSAGWLENEAIHLLAHSFTSGC